MHVAFINSLYLPYGASGAEMTLRFLSEQLAARGRRCSIVTLTPERSEETRDIDGISIYYLPLANVYWPHGGSRPRLLRPIFQVLDSYNPVMERRLRRVLERLRPDVVNAHNLQGFSVSAWRAADRLNIPVVQTLHDYYTACPRSAMWRPASGNCARQCADCRLFATPRRHVSALPAAITCVSHRVFDRIAATGTFVAAREGRQAVRIIRGNNPDAALPPLPPARKGGSWRFGFIGRLDPSKGLDILLEAMEGFAPEEATLTVAGTGHEGYAKALRARAAASENVQFVGHVTPASFYPEIDILVVPSIWEDPFPRVFHEALAHGVPSLVTPLGGLPEVIEPGRTGFIAEHATAPALYAAMRRAMDDRNHEAVRLACRAAARNFEPDRIVSQYDAVLLAAAARRAPSREAGETWRLAHSF